MKKSIFNISNKVINENVGQKVTFDYVVKRYNVTKEQLTEAMKTLRYTLERGVIYFDLKQICARYQPDSYKLETCARLRRRKKKGLKRQKRQGM